VAWTVRLSRRGQVTIPKAGRETLNLKPFDQLDVDVIGGDIRLRKRLTLEELAGIIPSLDPPMDPDEAIRMAKEERALRWIEKFGDPVRTRENFSCTWETDEQSGDDQVSSSGEPIPAVTSSTVKNPSP
jgi:AbrB family looped-hinge helix DNA binding protein